MAKPRYESKTTPGEMLTPCGYVVDCIFYYQYNYRNMSYKNSPEYSQSYFQVIGRLLKQYDIEVLEDALANNKIKTFRDYGLWHFFLKASKEKLDRLNSDKDASDPEELTHNDEDVRDKKDIIKRQKTKLEMLEDID